MEIFPPVFSTGEERPDHGRRAVELRRAMGSVRSGVRKAGAQATSPIRRSEYFFMLACIAIHLEPAAFGNQSSLIGMSRFLAIIALLLGIAAPSQVWACCAASHNSVEPAVIPDASARPAVPSCCGTPRCCCGQKGLLCSLCSGSGEDRPNEAACLCGCADHGSDDLPPPAAGTHPIEFHKLLAADSTVREFLPELHCANGARHVAAAKRTASGRLFLLHCILRT